jgi:uncharacterized membrane protein AbrB (regulator of aidB expression)
MINQPVASILYCAGASILAAMASLNGISLGWTIGAILVAGAIFGAINRI